MLEDTVREEQIKQQIGRENREIAIYGKGGIGKSTLTGNLSAALAIEGRSVLQIGCDPKHDSTRLLLGGKEITTVLDYIRETPFADYKMEDILHQGFENIGCIEAGGPKPGVGCAGRGIITVFELLEQFQIKQKYDTVIYDVLGDVVCGGFAVPIRKEYANTIFLVSSGEYMSIYAANNILRGIQNYDTSKNRVAGILYNKRNIEGEDARVEAFAKAVGLPICMRVDRSDVFTKAEKENRTVMAGEDCIQKRNFQALAKEVIAGIPLHAAAPLTDSELEAVVLGIQNRTKIVPHNVYKESELKESHVSEVQPLTSHNRYISKGILRDEPLHGCAFSGALTMSIHLKDVVILAHSPKSCTYISYQAMSSPLRRQYFERGAIVPVFLANNLVSTEMDEVDMVFGGMEKLKAVVQEIAKDNPKAIVIVSSCPSGIIGDDIEQLKHQAFGNTPIVTIKADGNLAGDYMQGMLLAYTSLARQIIDPKMKPVEDVVNIVFEKTVAKNTDLNFTVIRSFLAQMQIQINCRFLYDTDYDRLQKFCTAKLNLLAYQDYTGQMLQGFFEKEYQAEFFDLAFPIGYYETEAWLQQLGHYFQKEAMAAAIIQEHKQQYETRLQRLRPRLQGKKLMILTYNHELDWILRPAIEIGMELVKIGILNFSQDEGFRTKLDVELPVELNYNGQQKKADVLQLQPDVVLTNYETSILYARCITDTIPMCPNVGFFTGVEMLEKWDKLLDFQLVGGWKKDEQLYNDYYAR